VAHAAYDRKLTLKNKGYMRASRDLIPIRVKAVAQLSTQTTRHLVYDKLKPNRLNPL